MQHDFDTSKSVVYPGLHFGGRPINSTQIIYLPGWEIVVLAACPFAVQCLTIFGYKV